MQTFDTSYGYDRFSFKLGLNDIIISRHPLSFNGKKLLIGVYNDLDNVIINTSINLSINNKIPLKSAPDGKYYLNIYSNSGRIIDNRYYAYFQPRSISLLVKNNRWHFIVAPIINKNREIISKLLINEKALLYYQQPSALSQSDNQLIIDLAKQITKFKVTPMQKILAIHDWVAENIYYDYDALLDRSCDNEEYSAIDVLKSKKCVCRGYANLAIALMRAVGIPAIGQRCYALNIDNDGGWDKPENQSAGANHIIAIAFVDNRWIYMDITWDSDNRYENGKFVKKTGLGVSRKYFDTTLEMISNTHKFV